MTTDIDNVLAQMTADLRAAAPTVVRAVVLYGGLAKGRFTPGISDINVLVVVERGDLAALTPLAPVLMAMRRAHRVETLVATLAELAQMAILFPVKVRDMQRAHRVLFGEPGINEIAVAPDDLVRRARQELTNLAMRLRRRALERGADPAVMWRGLVGSLPGLAVVLETLLDARGVPIPAGRPAVLRAGAAALGLDPAAIKPFAELHRQDPAPAGAHVLALAGAYLLLLEDLAQRVGGR